LGEKQFCASESFTEKERHALAAPLARGTAGDSKSAEESFEREITAATETP
jgi:hypothetical protein